MQGAKQQAQGGNASQAKKRRRLTLLPPPLPLPTPAHAIAHRAALLPGEWLPLLEAQLEPLVRLFHGFEGAHAHVVPLPLLDVPVTKSARVIRGHAYRVVQSAKCSVVYAEKVVCGA